MSCFRMQPVGRGVEILGPLGDHWWFLNVEVTEKGRHKGEIGQGHQSISQWCHKPWQGREKWKVLIKSTVRLKGSADRSNGRGRRTIEEANWDKCEPDGS